MAISASQVMELRNLTGAGMMDCKKALQESDGDMEKAHDFLRKKGIATAQKKSGRETNEGGVAVAFSDDGRTAAIVQLACETDFVARNENFQALLNRLAAQVLAQGDQELESQTVAGGEGTVSDLLTEEIARMGENLKLVDARRITLESDGTIGGYVHSNGKIGVLVAVTGNGASGEGLDALAKDLAMHVAASQVEAIRAEDLDAAVLDKEREIFVAQAKESGKPDNIIEKMVEGRLKKFIAESTLLSQPFVKDPDRTVAQMLNDVGGQLGGKPEPVAFVKFQF